jgi:hypothetical protein
MSGVDGPPRRVPVPTEAGSTPSVCVPRPSITVRSAPIAVSTPPAPDPTRIPRPVRVPRASPSTLSNSLKSRVNTVVGVGVVDQSTTDSLFVTRLALRSYGTTVRRVETGEIKIAASDDFGEQAPTAKGPDSVTLATSDQNPASVDHADLSARLSGALAEIAAMRAERQFLMEEQERFIRMLMDEHAAELAARAAAPAPRVPSAIMAPSAEDEYQELELESDFDVPVAIAVPVSMEVPVPIRAASPPAFPEGAIEVLEESPSSAVDLESIGIEVLPNSDRPPPLNKTSGTWLVGQGRRETPASAQRIRVSG